MKTIYNFFKTINQISDDLDTRIQEFQDINRENKESASRRYKSFPIFTYPTETAIKDLISNIRCCFEYYDCEDKEIQSKLANYINKAFELIRKYENEVSKDFYYMKDAKYIPYINHNENQNKDTFKNNIAELRSFAFKLSDNDAKKSLFGITPYTLYNKNMEDDSKDDCLRLLRTLSKDDAFEILENLCYYSEEKSFSYNFTKEAKPNVQNSDNAIIFSILNDDEPVVSLEQYCKLHNVFFSDDEFKADRYSKNELIDVLRSFINQHIEGYDQNVDFCEKYIRLIAQTLEQTLRINLNTSGSIDDIVNLLKPIIIELNDRRSKNEVEQEIGNNSINEEQLKLAPKLLNFYDYIRLLVNSGVNIEDIKQLPYENMNDLYLGTKQTLAGSRSDKESGYCKKIVEAYLKEKKIDLKDADGTKEDEEKTSNEQFLRDFVNYYEKEQLLEIDKKISPLEKLTNDHKFEEMGFNEGQECDEIVKKIVQLFDNYDSEKSCKLDQNKIAKYLGRLANIYALGLAHSAGVYEASGFKSRDEYANSRISRLCDIV